MNIPWVSHLRNQRLQVVFELPSCGFKLLFETTVQMLGVSTIDRLCALRLLTGKRIKDPIRKSRPNVDIAYVYARGITLAYCSAAI